MISLARRALRFLESERSVALFGLAVIIPALLPWLVSYWPAEELTQRLAVASVVQDLQDNSNSPFAAAFSYQLHIEPGMAFDWLLRVLAGIVGIEAAGRVVLSACIIALPLSVLFLVCSLAPTRWRNAFWAIPLASGPLLQHGLLGLLLSTSLAIAALAMLWRAQSKQKSSAVSWTIGGAGALLLLSALFHGVPALCAAFFFLCLVGARPARKTSFLALTPPVLLHIFGGPEAALSLLGPFVRFDLSLLVSSYSTLETLLRVLCLGGAVLGIALRFHRNPSSSQLDQGVLRVAILLPVVWILAPTFYPEKFVSAGVLLIGICCLLVGFAEGPTFRRAVAPLALAIVSLLTLLQFRWLSETSERVKEVVDFVPPLEEGRQLLYLDFSDPPTASWDSVLGTTGLDRMDSLRPLRFASAHLVIRDRVLTPTLAGSHSPSVGRFQNSELVTQADRVFRSPLKRRQGHVDLAPFIQLHPPGSMLEGNFAEFLQWQCPPPAKACLEHYQVELDHLSMVVDAFDYVYVINPPPGVASVIEAQMQTVRRSGDLWLSKRDPS